MLPLMIPLKDVFGKSAFRDMSAWFADMPNDASWYVISDYCVGDQNKQNDTVSFSVLLNYY
ncbi:MAG: N-acetyltransferase, partial [Nitrospirota bacterium]|nr:N-acetyltransferase [Nitrospirota bacterium]